MWQAGIGPGSKDLDQHLALHISCTSRALHPKQLSFVTTFRLFTCHMLFRSDKPLAIWFLKKGMSHLDLTDTSMGRWLEQDSRRQDTGREMGWCQRLGRCLGVVHTWREVQQHAWDAPASPTPKLPTVIKGSHSFYLWLFWIASSHLLNRMLDPHTSAVVLFYILIHSTSSQYLVKTALPRIKKKSNRTYLFVFRPLEAQNYFLCFSFSLFLILGM